jgi:hypothetical protein
MIAQLSPPRNQGQIPPVLGSVRIRIGLSEDPPGQDLAIYHNADPRYAWKLNFNLSSFSLSHFNLFYLMRSKIYLQIGLLGLKNIFFKV